MLNSHSAFWSRYAKRNHVWRYVIRTGRTSAPGWERAFGDALAPVLDVGAGDSPWVGELQAQRLLAVGLDPQYTLRPPHQSVPGPRCGVAGLAEALPFKDAVFGTVFLGHVLQHVTDPVAALRECLRVSLPAGRVVVHPVWARESQLQRAAASPGILIIPGRRRPRRRAGVTLDPSVPHSQAALRQVARALVPALPVRLLGRAAMRIVVAGGGSTAVGPGATR